MSNFSGTERYKLHKKIGSGGMGTVYQATDNSRGINVALKCMHEITSGNLVAFKREFRSIADLHHPNLVRLLDLTDTGDELFYTMEFVDGVNLAQLIYGRSKRASALSAPDFQPEENKTTGGVALPISSIPSSSLSERDITKRLLADATDIERMYYLLPQILDALEFLHSHQIVHRDLKPDNILVTPNSKVKLVDFGIIKDMRPGRQTSRNPEQVVGTIQYMAPEQIHAKEITSHTDMYTLGCVLYEYFAGRLPFEGSAFEIMAQHLNEKPIPLESINPKVPKQLVDICNCLLAKNPSERLNIAQVRQVLGIVPQPQQRKSLAPEPHSNNKFVGRGASLNKISSQLERVREGQLELTLVDGDSGTGKTYLADEAIKVARQKGYRIFRGRCYEREQLAFRAFDGIMDDVSIALKHECSPEKESYMSKVRSLSWIFPSFNLLEKDVRPTSWSPFTDYSDEQTAENDPQTRRSKAYAAIKPMVELLTDNQPALFVIDDFHWADVESIEFLQGIVQNARRQPLLILCTYRSKEMDERERFGEFLRTSIAQATCTSITLKEFTYTETRRLARRVAEYDLSEAETLQIHEQAKGIPLFVKELTEYFVSNKQMSTTEALPSFSNLIEQRLLDLSKNARKVAVFMSAAQGPINAIQLQGFCELELPAFNQALHELTDKKIFRIVSTRIGRESLAPPAMSTSSRTSVPPVSMSDAFYDFYHDCIRIEAYGLLERETRTELHKRFAKILEIESPQPSEALAYHWRQAGYSKRAIVHGLRAAENSARCLAFSHAINSYNSILEEIETYGLVDDVSELFRSYERLAELYEFTGQYREAAEALRRGIQLLPSEDRYEGIRHQLTTHLAADLVKIGEVDAGTKIFNRLLSPFNLTLTKSFIKSLLNLGSLRGRLLVSSFVKRLFGRRRREISDKERNRLELFRRVSESFGFVSPLAMAEYQMRFQVESNRVNLPSAIVHSTALEAIYLASTNFDVSVNEKAHLLLDDANEVARSNNIPFAEAYTLGVRGFVDCAIGNWERARLELAEVIEGFKKQHALHRWEVRMCRSWLMLTEIFSGRVEQAADIAHEFCKQKESDIVQYSLGAWTLVEVHIQKGEIAEAEARLTEWASLIDHTQMTHFRFLYEVARNSVDAAYGRGQQVLDRMQRIEREVRDSGCTLGGWDLALWNLSGISAAITLMENNRLFDKERTYARGLAKQLLKRSPMFFRCMGHKFIALLHGLEGNDKAMMSSMRTALSLSETAGVPFYRLQCLVTARKIGVFDSSLTKELARLQVESHFRDA
ncbi:MAG: BREX system ATP-binding domain-containing protein [Myxococcota bacterium]|nr:BREX system ATP-binding domain-containing protein [Myxococcota bacterium]